MGRRSPWLKAPFIPKTTSHFSPLGLSRKPLTDCGPIHGLPSIPHSSCGISPSVQQVKDRLRRCIGTKSDGVRYDRRRLAAGKRKVVFLSSAKISTIFRISEIFLQQKSPFSRTYSKSPKTRGLFSKMLLFLPSSPLFFAKDAQALSDFALGRPYAHV